MSHNECKDKKKFQPLLTYLSYISIIKAGNHFFLNSTFSIWKYNRVILSTVINYIWTHC